MNHERFLRLDLVVFPLSSAMKTADSGVLMSL